MTRAYKFEEIELTPDPVKPVEHKTLRMARLNDIPELLEMGKRLVNEGPMKKIGFQESKARRMLEQAIIAPDNEWLALVSHKEDKPVGVLVAYCMQPVFSDEKVAVECFWWLEPDHRSGRRGLDMMEAYEYWAKLIGCKVVQYGWLISSPEKMKLLYDRIGAEKSEEVYYKCL